MLQHALPLMLCMLMNRSAANALGLLLQLTWTSSLKYDVVSFFLGCAVLITLSASFH